MNKLIPILLILSFVVVSAPATAPLPVAFAMPSKVPPAGRSSATIQSQSDGGLDNFVFYVGRSSNYAWAGTLNGLGRFNLGGQFWESFNSSDGLGADSYPSLLYLPDRGRLLVHPQRCYLSASVIYAAYGYGLRISDDEGENWRAVEPLPMMGSGQCVWRLIADSGRVYAACWYAGLAYSDDAGDSWSVYSIPYIDPPGWIFELVGETEEWEHRSFSVAARGNLICTGTDYGLYVSHDRGTNWEFIDVTLAGMGCWVYDVHIDGNGVIWAACIDPYGISAW